MAEVLEVGVRYIVGQLNFSVGVPDEEVVELQQRRVAEGFSEAPSLPGTPLLGASVNKGKKREDRSY